MRTAHRILATAGLAGATQNAPVGDAGLWISADLAFGPAVACSLQVAAALVPTRRLAPVEGQSAPLSPALGSQSALASPSSTRGGLAPLSSALSHHLARLFLTLVDHPLAPVWIFVLKLCSGSWERLANAKQVILLVSNTTRSKAADEDTFLYYEVEA